MNVNIPRHLGAVTRVAGTRQKDGKPARFVSASRTFDTTPEDLWDALTNYERIPRWFLPAKGDSKKFALEGDVSGSVISCNAPTQLSLKWGESWVDVQLHREQRHTRVTIEQTAFIDDEQWKKFGPGLLGLGWEQALLRLTTHIDSGIAVMPDVFATWLKSFNGHQFIQGATDSWAEAAVKASVDPVDAHMAATRVAEKYSVNGRATA